MSYIEIGSLRMHLINQPFEYDELVASVERRFERHFERPIHTVDKENIWALKPKAYWQYPVIVAVMIHKDGTVDADCKQIKYANQNFYLW